MMDKAEVLKESGQLLENYEYHYSCIHDVVESAIELLTNGDEPITEEGLLNEGFVFVRRTWSDLADELLSYAFYSKDDRGYSISVDFYVEKSGEFDIKLCDIWMDTTLSYAKTMRDIRDLKRILCGANNE